jgi:hypothetical protein
VPLKKIPFCFYFKHFIVSKLNKSNKKKKYLAKMFLKDAIISIDGRNAREMGFLICAKS